LIYHTPRAIGAFFANKPNPTNDYLFRTLDCSMKQLCQLSIITAVATPFFAFACDEAVTDNHAMQKTAKNAAVICPAPTKTGTTQNAEEAKAIKISAKHTTLLENDRATFKGGVVICSEHIAVTSDTAKFSRSEKSVKAQGNINYHNDVVDVKSTNFEASISENKVQLEQAEYFLSENVGHGTASLFEVSKENLLVLNDATFTTCPIDNDGWLLAAEEISLSSKEGWGAAWNANIKINNTPIIYIPYLTFPLDDRRTTGFLYPNLTSSKKHGIEIKSPWYWNIAPNFDATITPRLMTKRGVQLQSELRYLTDQHDGLFNIEYLPEDSERVDLDSRHMVHWQHNSQYGDNFRAFIDFTQISDDAYLNDLGSAYHDTTDTQLNQHLEFAYFANNIDAAFRVQNFEVLGQHPSSYQTLPQVELANRNAYKIGGLDFNWFGEVSRFSNSQANIVKANRVHLEPSLSLDYNTMAWSLSSELSVLHTNYSQQYSALENRDDQTINRTLPKFRLHSIVNFERPSRFFGQNGLQTFEPQLQYLYVPFKDQSEIGEFDSTRLQDDYHGLFRDNRFSGLDRIGDANQITLGATSRFINPENEELMRLSFGQILYLQDDDRFIANDDRLRGSKSALAGEMFLHWSKRWYLNASVQYDTGSGKINKSNLTLDYRADKFKLAQLNHRRTRNVSGDVIEQLGFVASFPISDNWQFVGGYHRDLTENRSIDSYAGIQYESCCWAIRLVTRRHINTNLEQLAQNTSDLPSTFDSGISLQLVIKGLNGTSGFDISDMLQQGIFGYRRPYFLNN
jgi:LPS-assembly protein